MICFYIDTTSNYLYTGLSKDNLLLIERKLNLAHDLSTFALDEVRKMFSDAKIEPNDVDKIIIDTAIKYDDVSIHIPYEYL